MTNAPEAILCREASIPYAGLAIITNFGCGLKDTPAAKSVQVTEENSVELSHSDVEQAMTAAACDLKTWIPDALSRYIGSVAR
jgi:purine nucleoside phosphorylase